MKSSIMAAAAFLAFATPARAAEAWTCSDVEKVGDNMHFEISPPDDDERGVWKDRPRHDAASHGADAFRSLAMVYRDVPIEAKPEGLRDPVGRVIPIKSIRRDFKVLTEMTYDEFAPLCPRQRRRERV
jgi:hypothetical protein